MSRGSGGPTGKSSQPKKRIDEIIGRKRDPGAQPKRKRRERYDDHEAPDLPHWAQSDDDRSDYDSDDMLSRIIAASNKLPNAPPLRAPAAAANTSTALSSQATQPQSFQERITKRLVAALERTPDDEDNVLEVAMKIGEAIVALGPGRSGDKARILTKYLELDENDELRSRLLSRKLSPDELCRMTVDQLAPACTVAVEAKLLQARADARNLTAMTLDALGSGSGLFTCRSCGSNKCINTTSGVAVSCSKWGPNETVSQCWKCVACGATFTE